MDQCAGVQLDGGRILIGGPEARTHPPHEHAEAQVTIHLPYHERKQEDFSFQAWVVASHAPHAGGWPEGTLSAVFHLTPDLLASSADELSCRGNCELRGGTVEDPLIAQIGRTAAGEILSGQNGSVFLDSLQLTMAGWLVRTRTGVTGQGEFREELLSRQRRLALREFIESRLDQPVRVAEIAAAVGLGPHRLTRLLKSTTGLSPHEFVTQIRIERARELLKSRDLTIAEIAFRLGFANQSHFTATFRKRLGTTPRKYRACWDRVSPPR